MSDMPGASITVLDKLDREEEMTVESSPGAPLVNKGR
jgi:hypothetical protein